VAVSTVRPSDSWVDDARSGPDEIPEITYPTCGADLDDGGDCLQPAGWGTDHDDGRCAFHRADEEVDRGRGIETDGGDLPEHLTEMDRLDGGTNIRCLTCGAEAERERHLDHRIDCPETEQGIRTDGGPEVVENQASGVSITAKLKRGTGTRDQDEIKVKAKGTTADEARANMAAVLPKVEQWADELRGVQPGDADE
jgi:hypothetical protein